MCVQINRKASVRFVGSFVGDGGGCGGVGDSCYCNFSYAC